MSRILAAAVLAASSLALPVFAQGIEIHDAYAIASRPNAPSGAAFMMIENHADADDRLVSVSAPVAQRVEIHEHMIDEDGVAHMRELPDGIIIPAEGHALLERGADHVMFMGITEPFEDGLIIPLTLHFEVAGEVLVEVPVDLARLGEAGDDHDHDHDMHDDHDDHGEEDHAEH